MDLWIERGERKAAKHFSNALMILPIDCLLFRYNNAHGKPAVPDAKENQ